MAWPMERNQSQLDFEDFKGFIFFNSIWTIVFYKHPKRDFWGEIASIKWPFEIRQKKTLILYYVLLQLTCSCHCCWPSSFLPSRVASKRAQGFSSEVDILESIRRVFVQRQVCIWNKCARDHFFRENSVCSLIVSVNGSLCIQLFILFHFAQDLVFEIVHQCFVIHISLITVIRLDIPCSDDCAWHFRHQRGMLRVVLIK